MEWANKTNIGFVKRKYFFSVSIIQYCVIISSAIWLFKEIKNCVCYVMRVVSLNLSAVSFFSIRLFLLELAFLNTLLYFCILQLCIEKSDFTDRNDLQGIIFFEWQFIKMFLQYFIIFYSRMLRNCRYMRSDTLSE